MMSPSFDQIALDVAAVDRPASDPMNLERMDRAPTHPGEILLTATPIHGDADWRALPPSAVCASGNVVCLTHRRA
jgi:hypothetical protein